MNTFKELESKFKHLHLTLGERGAEGSGILVLDGRSTKSTISSREPLDTWRDGDGFFDVRLKSTDGMSVLLHNSILLRTQFPSNPQDFHENIVFPNLVVFDASRIKNDQVRTISFSVENIGNFFHFEHIEWQILHDVPKDTVSNLRQFRRAPEIYPREYKIFNPTQIYIVHELPRVIRFQVGDRVYRVDVGVSGLGFGWGRVSLASQFQCSIQFRKPVSIDNALDRIWEWRRFFQQCAMEPLPFEYISGRNGPRSAGSASFYSPHPQSKPSGEVAFRFHPSEAPLNEWDERERLSDVMQQWIEKEADRARFRVNVDSVIAHMDDRTQLDDITSLCAAIESLDEFLDNHTYTGDQIERLVTAASEVASREGIDVTDDRLRGVLSMLNTRGLPARLRALTQAIQPLLPGVDFKILTKSILELRGISAHGRTPSDRSLPKLGPAIQALASACVVWDLQTSGMPIGASSARVRALGKITESVGYLAHIKQQKVT